MQIGIVSLFPEMFKALEYGIVGKAIKKGIIELQCQNPRDYAFDKSKTVDDRPYGGGPGMVLKVEPMLSAIRKAKSKQQGEVRVIALSPQGRRVTQTDIASLAKEKSLVLVAGRYEGIDERLIDLAVDEELSIGDYVLSGGELGAMVLIDAVARLLPGVLGHKDSANEDSFNRGLLDCPHYTRPEEIKGLKVPEVLLSGDHAAIANWRKEQQLERTRIRRPDLFKLFKEVEQEENCYE